MRPRWLRWGTASGQRSSLSASSNDMPLDVDSKGNSRMWSKCAELAPSDSPGHTHHQSHGDDNPNSRHDRLVYH